MQHQCGNGKEQKYIFHLHISEKKIKLLDIVYIFLTEVFKV
jgi:hypothetical protein